MELESLPTDREYPPKNPSDYRNLSKEGLFKRYLQSATIHGVPLSDGPEHYRFRRPIWRVLITIMAAGLGWTQYSQVSNLMEYPIRTVTRATLKGELTFPAVTICNLNQYIRDRVPDIPIIEQVFLYESQYARMAKQTGNFSKTFNLADYEDVSGEELARIARKAAPRLEDFLLQCSWSLYSYKCKDLFKPIQTGYGTCFVFNGPDIEPDKLRKAVGFFSALGVLIETQNSKSYYSRVVHAGIKVIVHQPDEKPFPLYQGWYMRPGVAASMALSREESKGLPRPYKAFNNGYCEENQRQESVNGVIYNKTYNTEHCLSDCLYKQLEDECGCKHYHSLGDRPYCSAKQILGCYMPASKHLNKGDVAHCGCRRQCDTISYTADTSYSNFASKFIEGQAVRDGLTFFDGHFRENIIDLNVFFKSLTVMEVIQEPETSLTTVLGTLGGQMGLFLGASVLSVTELVELLVLLLLKTGIFGCLKTRTKETTESEELDK